MTQRTCECKSVDIITGTNGTPTVKLVAVLIACGVTDTKQIAAATGLKLRAAQAAKSAAECAQHTASAQHTAPNAAQCTQHTAPLARAYKESLRDKSSHLVEQQDPPSPPNGGPDGMPKHVKPVASWSSAFERQDAPDHAKVVRLESGAIQLLNSTRQFWLKRFGEDAERLDLALIEIAGEINQHSRKPLVADVESRLARKVADKLDRDARYEAAAKRNAASGKSKSDAPVDYTRVALQKLKAREGVA